MASERAEQIEKAKAAWEHAKAVTIPSGGDVVVNKAEAEAIEALLRALSPVRAQEPTDSRECSCLGFCKGREGLSSRYRCALDGKAGKVAALPPVQATGSVPVEGKPGLYRSTVPGSVFGAGQATTAGHKCCACGVINQGGYQAEDVAGEYCRDCWNDLREHFQKESSPLRETPAAEPDELDAIWNYINGPDAEIGAVTHARLSELLAAFERSAAPSAGPDLREQIVSALKAAIRACGACDGSGSYVLRMERRDCVGCSEARKVLALLDAAKERK